jgi:hypothetical protein
MMDNSFYLAITFLSPHHKHLLLIISVSSTNCPSSSEVTTVMSVMDERHGGQEAEGATKQKVEHWGVTTLTGWLNKALDPPLHSEDIEKIEKERIGGRAFLAAAGDRDFFRAAGCSLGASAELASLAKEVNSTIQGKLLSFIPYSNH